MVKTLHAAGIEVILDVVYNHTAEGNHLGPMLSFQGIDNLAYYRVVDDDPRHYLDYTGTGNSLNMRHPHVLQLIMDSLRYWVTEMHVDGFRFDLASTLARELHDVDRLSAFFDLVQQDPVVSQVKLIAEPWDVGEGGYQVGNFPPLWSEWNGRYRDTSATSGAASRRRSAEFGYRFTGSSTCTRPTAGARRRRSTSSPPTTASRSRDLVSYNDKHNEANGEDNRDGETHNRSWNCGVEGPTDDPAVDRPARPAAAQPPHHAAAVAGRADAARRRRDRAHAGRQQQRLLPGQRDLVVRLDEHRRRAARLVPPGHQLRRDHPVFRRRRWFQGRRIRAIEDLAWFRPDGARDDRRRLGGRLRPGRSACSSTARPSRRTDAYGGRIVDDSFFVMFNANGDATSRGPCRPPSGAATGSSSSTPACSASRGTPLGTRTTLELVDRSVVVLRSPAAVTP